MPAVAPDLDLLAWPEAKCWRSDRCVVVVRRGSGAAGSLGALVDGASRAGFAYEQHLVALRWPVVDGRLVRPYGVPPGSAAHDDVLVFVRRPAVVG